MAKSLEDVQMLPLPNSKSKEREERSEEGEESRFGVQGSRLAAARMALQAKKYIGRFALR